MYRIACTLLMFAGLIVAARCTLAQVPEEKKKAEATAAAADEQAKADKEKEAKKAADKELEDKKTAEKKADKKEKKTDKKEKKTDKKGKAKEEKSVSKGKQGKQKALSKEEAAAKKKAEEEKKKKEEAKKKAEEEAREKEAAMLRKLQISRDEELLRSVGIAPDAPGLLEYFRLRSQPQANPERLTALIERLADKSPVASLKALGELASIGAPAVPALRQAIHDPDLKQTARLAQRCLKVLEEHPGQLSAAATRLLGQLHPAGTVQALLAFLPVAEDEGVIEEIRIALGAAAYTDNQPDPILLRALTDSTPALRAMAIEALCQNGVPPSLTKKTPLNRLLQDPMPSVRLRAGLALARLQNPKAVSTLVTLLTDLPLDYARQAEDYLSELAGDQAPKAMLAEGPAARKKCRDAWAVWWLDSEDPERLLKELAKRTPSDDVRKKGALLIRQLGDSEFKIRQKAEAEIRKVGVIMLPLLRKAAKSNDLEVRIRAQRCLAAMEKDKNLPMTPMVPRLVALRKPPGSVEALLGYIPFADEELILSEVQIALNAVSFSNTKPHPMVVHALSDTNSARRAAAGEALCLGGAREYFPMIRKMLRDKDPAVRMKTALALAGARERDVMPTLIDIIAELPTTQSSQIEEYLYRMAGDKAPVNLPAGDGDKGANRKKRRDAWAAWWKTNEKKVALVDRYPPFERERYYGYTLLVLPNNNGTIVELDTEGRKRWEITGLNWPRDAQVVGHDRVLIAEQNGQCVSERNLRGEIIWKKQLGGCNPVGVQRLRNGRTFIACMNKLIELDRGGREVMSINRPNNDVCAARKMRDGSIIVVSQNNQIVRLDSSGKELKSFQVQMAWHNGIDILDNGHVIIPEMWFNRVTEYDAEGKSVWQTQTVQQPMSACRLPNGNTLIGQQWWPQSKLYEIDPSGKTVSEKDPPGNNVNCVQRIRRR